MTWLIVAGDLTPLGGMDAANLALARYLASRDEVHLVTHRAWPDLAALPNVTVHAVWRPFNRHLLGSPLLAGAGRALWRRLGPLGARAVVNDGNGSLPDANWVHYLHAAYKPQVNRSIVSRTTAGFTHRRDVDAEIHALAEARVILCNSSRTKRDVMAATGVPDARVRVIYYGSDPERFPRIEGPERRAARKALGQVDERRLVGFLGALGDRRKAFDTLFEAWADLCRRREWDADLIVVGSGAELAAWRQRAARRGLGDRLRFLGFRRDVPTVLAALDALVHPARYEAYGLSVHEAICRGIPALVSRSAGVAERYPEGLADLLIDDPNDSAELVRRLSSWRERLEAYRGAIAPVAESFRSYTWDQMAAQIIECVERAAA